MSIERKLVDALKSQDAKKIETIFKNIYDSNYKLVYFCVANFISIKEDIEEIVNDVFINFYNHLDNINIEGNIKYYLTRSAKNACINYLKKKDYENKLIRQLNQETKVYVEYQYQDDNFINKLKNMLNKDEFDLLFNHVVLGYTLKEVSQMLNISSNTIKSKYRRLILKIKNTFKGGYYE